MKIKNILIFIIALVLLLTSCDVFEKRIYTNKQISYFEPIANYGFIKEMELTETGLAKYFFESNINNKERESCIKATEKLLASQSLEGITPEIYIFSQETYNYKYIIDHKLYCSIQNWKSVEYIADVLIAIYGETAHYGTVFGYANYLAKIYKWKNYNGEFLTPSVTDIFDLNYLCFDENFATQNDILIAKEISCDFVDSYIKQHGEKAVQQLLSSHTKATNALSSYYEGNGIIHTPSNVKYGYGGATYDYIVYSDYATFYIYNDWVDINAEYNPLIIDGFLHSNYADTKAFFETNINQMKQYQELFDLDYYNNDLDIIFTSPISASKYSFYQNVNHRIYLYNVDSLMHEYIHSLTMPTSSMASWKVEGFARYFSYYYDFYGIALLNQDYNNTSDTSTMKWVHEYLATINRPIDMAKDYRELENVAVYSFSYTNPNKNYLTGSSFVQYLVKQYGEEAVINSIYGNGNPLPKTYAELVKEWNEFIESSYSGYSKYK